MRRGDARVPGILHGPVCLCLNETHGRITCFPPMTPEESSGADLSRFMVDNRSADWYNFAMIIRRLR